MSVPVTAMPVTAPASGVGDVVEATIARQINKVRYKGANRTARRASIFVHIGQCDSDAREARQPQFSTEIWSS